MVDERNYRFSRRFIALFFGLVLFVVFIPAGIIAASAAIDRAFSLSLFASPPLTLIVGILIGAAGLLFAGWTVWVQVTLGRGTPVPLLPPRKLLTGGPYGYCRNPMVFGILAYYLGLAIWLGSWTAVVLVIGMAVVMTTYLKLVEEPKLEDRFGQEYRRYKVLTPFLIPRPR